MKGNFLPLVFVPHFEKGGARGDLNLGAQATPLNASLNIQRQQPLQNHLIRHQS
jgi:hypothetical protein